jgi:cytochrome c oxidase assembly factor CtaG
VACCLVVMCWFRLLADRPMGERVAPLPAPLASRLGRHWKAWLALSALTEIGVGLLIVAVVVDVFRPVAAPSMIMVGDPHDAAFGLTLLLLLGLLAGAAALFARAAARPVPAPIVAGFGLLCFAVAFLPVVRTAADESHVAFMAQLMLVLLAAPVLIVVARSSMPNVSVVPATVVRVGAPLAAVGYVGVLYLWHLPRLHESAMTGTGGQPIELVSLALVGLVLWGLVLGDRRAELAGTRLAAVLVAAVPSGLLGLALILSPRPLLVGAMNLPWGISPLGDQRLSGIVMMIADLAFVVPLTGLVAAAAPPVALNRRPPVTV